MDKGYGRWTTKKEQWQRVTNAIECRISKDGSYETVMESLRAAGVGEKLSEMELEAFEEFVVRFAREIRR